jgi:glutathione peroxidase
VKIVRLLLKIFYPIRMTLTKLTGWGATKKSNNNNMEAPVSFYSLRAIANNGATISFEQYKGKKLLLVNLASNCGYTSQYAELEALNKAHGSELTILGFPANDFGGQEPGSDEEIASFCQVNYGVSFPLFKKQDVTGADQQPVYQWLSDAAKNGWNKQAPTWNFCKYLVSEKGELLHFFSSAVSPMGREILSELKPV